MTDPRHDESVKDPSTAARIPLPDKQRLADAVSAIRGLGRRHIMRAVVSQLADELGADFHPSVDEQGVLSPNALVLEAIRLGATRQLVDVLRIVVGNDRDLDTFAELVETAVPRFALTDGELETLDDALIDLPPEALRAAVERPEFGLSAQRRNLSLRDVLTLLDRESTDPQARLRLLTFLETVAHQVDQFGNRKVHAVIDKIVSRFSLNVDVRAICRDVGTLPPLPGVDVHDDATTTEPTEEGRDGLTAVPAAPPSADEQPPEGGDDMRTTSPSVPSETITLATPAIMGGVPPRNPNFVGRRDILEHLAQTLAQHGRAAVLPTTLRGLGGIGKSQLAAEFARRYQGAYQLIWWIPADNARSIRRSFVSLARRLGIPESADVQNTVETVLDRLRNGDPYRRWLLIFDDATDPAVVTPYLPGGPGQVLLSSRLRTWHGTSEIIELDVFDPTESVEFLAGRWEGLTHDEALDLAERLGHLPLALDQAAAVHAESGMPLGQYLELLEASPAQILDEGESTQYPTSLAKTWQLAFEQLSESSPAAAQLLEVCAFLSSNPIAVPMLTRGRGARLPEPLGTVMRDDLKMRRAVRDMGRYALAQLDTSRDFIKIHMLVRAVLRDKMPPDRRLEVERAAQDLLALANPGTPDQPDTWPQHGQVAPHVLSSGVIHAEDAHVRKIVVDQMRYTYVIGDYAESRDLAAEALGNWRNRLGPDDEMTLLARFHLGNALRSLGDYAEARAINQDTLERMTRTLGRDHEYTLRCASSTAADYRLQGDFDRARRIDEENVAEATRTLGENDPATLRFVNNLAVDRRLLGDFAAATVLDEQNLLRRREILSEHHIEYLWSACNLVRDLYTLGRYPAALQQLTPLIPRIEKTRAAVGLQLLLLHAVLLRNTGDYARAVEVAGRSYADSASRFGDAHELTLAAATTLFNILRINGEVEGAAKLGEETLDGYTGALGAEHPFTLACATNLAAVQRALGKVEEAYDLDRRTQDAFERVSGPDHPYALVSAANLANDLALRGQASEAYEQSAQTYERSVRVREEDHPYTLFAGANFILDLEEVRRHEKAAELRAKIMPALRNKLGKEHPDVVNIERGRRAESVIEVPPT